MKESMRFTRQQAEEHQRKHFGPGVEPRTTLFAEAIPDPPDPMPEGEMHQKFGQWLNLNEVRYIHTPFGKKSQLPEGWPDFTVFLAGARVMFVELKGPVGTLTWEQPKQIAAIGKMGYEVLVTKSLAAAIMFVKAKL